MSKTNNTVFIALQIIAWVIFVGLCIEAGALLVNFFFSLYNPAVVPKLYQKLDLHPLYLQSRSAFYFVYGFVIIISLLKALLFYTVIQLIHKIDLKNPFNDFVVKKISGISYFTLFIGLAGLIGRKTIDNLSHRGLDMQNIHQFMGDDQAYIIMGAVIYIIAVIFKKGVQLQHDNDLTI